MLSAARTCGTSDQKPSGIAGSIGAEGWMNGLPKKKARPMPNSIRAMPMAMSLTRGNLQIQPWSSAEQGAGDAGREHAQPGRAGQVGDGVADHGAEDEGAFEAEIDAAALLGQALAEADEQERRADADGAGEDGQRHAPQAEIGLVHAAGPLGWKILNRP